jgi:hypothetical protein
MLAILYLLGSLLADLFKSRSMLEAENLFLRHQLNIALRAYAWSSSAARQRQGAYGFASSDLAQPA